MRAIDLLRSKIPTEHFGVVEARHILGDWAHTRLSRLVTGGELERVKNGIYVFSEKHRRIPINKMVLSNLMFGPSYISLESAFEYYGLIPEKVVNITAVTPKRTKSFNTVLGLFHYRKVPIKSFYVGVKTVSEGSGNFIIATKEKAVTDKLYLDLHGAGDVFTYLTENLRFEEEDLAVLDIQLIKEFSKHYGSRKLELLVKDFADKMSL